MGFRAREVERKKMILSPEQPSIGVVRMPIGCGRESITLKRSSGGVATLILERDDEDNPYYVSVDMLSPKQFEDLWNLIESWTGKERTKNVG